MTPADLIVGLLFALTLQHVFNATTEGDTCLFRWSHKAWFKVAAASRRCSLSEQRRDASATFAAKIRQVLECARASAAIPPAPPFWPESGLIGATMTLIQSSFPKIEEGGKGSIKVN
jgi:hypothetical protein